MCKGCIACDTITVTVIPKPELIVSNDTTICIGDSLTLTANGTPSGGDYLWSTQETTSSITVSPNQDTDYIVSYSLGSGCEASDTISVTVNPVPQIDVSADTTICEGATASLSANGQPEGGDYLWSTGETTSTINVTPDSTTEYVVDYSLQGYCTISDTVVVNVVDQPELIVSNDTTICELDSVTLTANGTPPGGEYLWSTQETTSSITVSPDQDTEYNVTYTLPGGCSAEATVNVTVSGVTVTATPMEACPGDTVQLFAHTDCISGTPVCEPINPTPPVVCDDCDIILEGNVGGNTFIEEGQKACVPEGSTFNGSIIMNGGQLVVCGEATFPAFVINNGSIYVLGTAHFPNFTMNNPANALYNYGTLTAESYSNTGIFENYGTFDVTNDFNINAAGSVLNEGTITCNNLNNNGTFTNSGPLTVNQTLQNNSPGYFFNECQMDIAIEFINNTEFVNNGLINVGALSRFNSGSSLTMGDNALINTNDAIFLGNTTGPETDCSKISVANSTQIIGTPTFSGNATVCSPNPFNPNDIGYPNDCSCNATGIAPGNLTYSWTPTSGLNNPNIANPILTVTEYTEYTVTISNGIDSVTGSVEIEIGPDCEIINPALVNVSPNPFSDNLRISTQHITDSEFLITIISANGRIMDNRKVNNMATIDVVTENYAPGVYLIKVTTSTETYTRKIIKH